MHAPRKLSARSCALRSLFPSPLRWPLNTCAEFSGNALKPPFPVVLPTMASLALAAAAQGRIHPNLGETLDPLVQGECYHGSTPDSSIPPKTQYSPIICIDAVDSAESGITIKCKNKGG